MLFVLVVIDLISISSMIKGLLKYFNGSFFFSDGYIIGYDEYGEVFVRWILGFDEVLVFYDIEKCIEKFNS